LIETLVLQQVSERFDPDGPTADVFVAVDPAAEFPPTVVQMKRLDAIKPDQAIELPHGCVIVLFSCQRVAGGKHVARVKTKTKSFRVIDFPQYGAEVLEAVTERRALAGRCLKKALGRDVASFRF
jgi:hypothetical protein